MVFIVFVYWIIANKLLQMLCTIYLGLYYLLKSMLTYFGWQPRDVTHINTDNIVEMIDNKGLLTVSVTLM